MYAADVLAAAECIALLCRAVGELPELAGHQAALLQDSALLDSLAAMLLAVLRHSAVAQQLPPDRRPPFATWFRIAHIAHALTMPLINSARERRQGGDPASTVQPVAQLFLHAPVERPASEPGVVARLAHV